MNDHHYSSHLFGAVSLWPAAVVTFTQTCAPEATQAAIGDLWIDVGDHNKAYRFDGASWLPISDEGCGVDPPDANCRNCGGVGITDGECDYCGTPR